MVYRWLDDYNILRKQTHITPEELSLAHIFVAKEEENEIKELELMSQNDFNLILY